MKRLVLALVFILAFFCNAYIEIPLAQAIELTDSTGTLVSIKEDPNRIITLVPSLGELVADLLREDLDKIVGVSEFSTDPPALKKIPSIGPFTQINLEKIVSLKPDLVLATVDGNNKDQILHLRELGIPTFVVSTSDFSQIADSMRQVGAALGQPKRGKVMANRFLVGIDNIKKRALQRAADSARSKPSPRVLFQIGDDPLVVVGTGTFLSESLKTVGIKNVYEDSSSHYPRPSLEDILNRDPDLILIAPMEESRSKAFSRMAAKWAAFPKLKAVKEKRVKMVQGDLLLKPTIRLLEGLSLLERAIAEGDPKK